ncbi:MAG: hypothetical protein U5P41_12345 [Gammaproteobacteria bacterium]|nr:hypothetical protein [Gammaproteobacteria bacterium]
MGAGFNWSAGDSIGLEMILEFAARLTLDTGLFGEVDIFDLEFDLDPLTCRVEILKIAGESLMSLSQLEDLIGFKICPDDISIRPGVPFGTGGAQAGAAAYSKSPMSFRKLTPPLLPPVTLLDQETYGGAPRVSSPGCGRRAWRRAPRGRHSRSPTDATTSTRPTAGCRCTATSIPPRRRHRDLSRPTS